MSKINTLISLIKTPTKMIVPLADNGLLNWMPDKMYLKLAYYSRIGKKLNLKNPKSYNEKLQWLKIHDRKPIYHTLVDKYEVKKYVSNIIGSQYIVPNIGVWNKVNDIPFEELPKQYVLKCTHDSGSVVICHDKNQFDVGKAKRRLEDHQKKSTFWFGREWPYKGLKARIIGEQYLESGEKGLDDYKVLCFGGEPKLIEVHQGRRTKNHTQDFYTIDWKRTDIVQESEPMSDEPINKPKQLELMLELSRKLSAGFIHIRIDWFISNDHLYFGEMTFYDGSGFAAFLEDKYDYEMGEWIKLPAPK